MTTPILVSLHGKKIGLDVNNNLVLEGPDGKPYMALKAPISDVSTKLVPLTGSAITLTAALHANKVLPISDATAQTLTLPAATGSGDIYTFILMATKTGSQIIKVANSTDVMQGHAMQVSDDGTGGPVKGWICAASDDTITLNGTTLGGYLGDKITIQDIAAGKFQVGITGKDTGTEATPFSATV